MENCKGKIEKLKPRLNARSMEIVIRKFILPARNNANEAAKRWLMPSAPAPKPCGKSERLIAETQKVIVNAL